MARLYDTGIFSVNSSAGAIGVGYKLYFYTTGTSTPKNTYPTRADAIAGTNANPNPMVAAADGRWNPIWLTGGDYKVVLKDFDDVTLETRDPGDTAPDSANNIDFSHSTTYAAGTVGAKLDKIVTITDAPFNAVGDDSTDNAAAIEAAAAELGASGGKIIVPPGRFRFASNIDLPTNVPILIEGDGTSASELISVNGAKIVYAGTPSEFDGPQFFLSNIGIKTVGVQTHDIVDVSFTGGSGGTGMTFGCRDVEIAAYATTSSFRSALKLNNARNLQIDNLRILGDRDASPIVSQYGIDISGDSDPVEVTLSKVQAYFVQVAVYAHGELEGLTLSHCAFVAVKTGLKAHSDVGLAKPWVNVHDCHINAGTRCLDLLRFTQWDIHDNLFYNSVADATDIDHASIYIGAPAGAGVPIDGFIHHNGFHAVDATLPSNGIVFEASVGDDRTIIDANIFKSYDTAIWLSAATVNGVIVTDSNQFSGNTDNVINSGTGNLICLATKTAIGQKTYPDGLMEKWGSSVITLNASGDGVVTFAAAFPTAFLSAVACSGDATVAAGAAFSVNQGSSNASGMAFSVRPNPGAIAVRVNWEAKGH